MSLEFLLANNEDIKELVDLRVKLNQCDYEVTNQQELKEAVESLLKEELNKSVYFFIAKDEGKMVACSGLIIHRIIPYSTIISGKKGYITNVFTLEDYRKQGIQKELMKMSLDYAKNLGCERVELDAVNSKAINLYETYGFEKMHHRFSVNLS